MKQTLRYFLAFCLLSPVFSCDFSASGLKKQQSSQAGEQAFDWHSQSNAEQLGLNHLSLDILVDFDEKIIHGAATWHFEGSGDMLVLDTRDLDIDSVRDGDGNPLAYQLAEPKPFLGSALRIDLAPNIHSVTVFYRTQENATALQWLGAQQTSGKSAPFLYTQSETIYARSWIPCPDGPGIRFTYDAKVKVPTGLMALMSAENPTEKSKDGVYAFKMDQKIPAYLMALAVGDLQFRKIDERTGVYAEPSMLDKAHKEFEDVGKMVKTAEDLYGDYRWGRYDILVLPSGFPLGGMENPKLTFCTPTILAGDKSLVNLIAHELAHSWSGNLVTNATWEDFWLNEGFTVYFERRIMEAMHGKDYVEMLWDLSHQDLLATVENLGSDNQDTKLKLNLKDRDPDIGLTDIAYEKGAAFLRLIEMTVGRGRFDQFLNTYFNDHAFKTINTEQFLNYLEARLLKGQDEWAREIDVEKWVYGAGIPSNYPKAQPYRFRLVEQQIDSFNRGTAATSLATEGWSAYEWMHFLRNLPQPLPLDKMDELDAAYAFTKSQNNEIADLWFLLAIKSNYSKAFPDMKYFLYNTGRMKFLEPLYKELMQTDQGQKTAQQIYEKAKNNYHPLARKEVEAILYPKTN